MDEQDHTTDEGSHPIDSVVLGLMEDRMQAARALADAAATRDRLKAEHEEAEREYGTRWKDAERAGWTTKDLTTHLGLAAPAAVPRRRRTSPKKRSSSNDQTTDESTEQAPQQ